MTAPVPTPPAFSPRLVVGDPTAARWLAEVTLRLRREVCWLWRERGLTGAPPASGLLPPASDRLSAALDLVRHDAEKQRFFDTDETAAYLTARLAELRELPADERPPRGGFGWVARELRLAPADRFVLALALLPLADAAAVSVVAACQYDTARACPTLALAQRLWPAPEELLGVLEPGQPLTRAGLLPATTEWEAPLQVASAVARALLFPAASLAPLLDVVAPDDISCASIDLTVARLRSDEGQRPRLVPVLGPAGAPLAPVAARIARALGTAAVQPAAGARPSDVPVLLTLAWQRGVVLYLPDTLAADARDHEATWPAAWPPVPVVVVSGGGESVLLKRLPSASALPAVRLAALDYAARHALWRESLAPALGDDPALPAALADCARRFRHEAPAVRRLARALLTMRPLTAAAVHAACRADVDLGDLAQRLEPRFGIEDLMLPPKATQQIAELVAAVRTLTTVHFEWGTARAWNESGLSAMFAGPPGTGKTMAAEAIAAAAGMPVYRIDLSQVVNKYIGETEKNLRRLFDAADAADAVLFFDEADALFGKRTEVRDAHDRYANLEVSYLLERMERFTGLAVLATNRKKDLDEAFLRRLRFVIDFPMPGAAERLRIWQRVVPPGVDIAALDLRFLADRFTMAGGHIRNVVFHACLQSAGAGGARRLDMPTVLRAVRREFDKLGRGMSLEQFGPYGEAFEE